MRIAVDAMGGDNAPREIVRGVVEATSRIGDETQLVLVGQESVVREELSKHNGWQGRIEVVHAAEVVGMNESPVDAVRQKRDSSVMRMVELASKGHVDAVVSAGNTGACAAACQLRLRTLPGVSRPGIAVVAPTFYGPVLLCDVGANIAAKPHHLQQYAMMASVYSEYVVGVKSPRVGVLSVGEEAAKGTTITRQAAQLIRDEGVLNFIGNVEGRDLFRGHCDVAICDGFVGNVTLKLIEGLAEGLFKSIRRELSAIDGAVAKQIEPILERIWAKHDCNEYGGAPLLGVNGVCIICHGASDHRAICNATCVAERVVATQVNSAITDRLNRAAQVNNG